MLAPPREARKSGDRGQVSWLGGSSHPSAFPGMSPVASVTGAPLSQWRGRAGFTPASLGIRDGPGSPAIAIRLSGTLEAKGFRVPRRTLVARGAAVKPRATATERGGLDAGSQDWSHLLGELRLGDSAWSRGGQHPPGALEAELTSSNVRA